MKFLLASLLLIPTALVSASSTSSAATATVAATRPVHSLTISGPGVATYPKFKQSVMRYGITTTDASTGTVQVAARTTDTKGTIRINGRVAQNGKRTVRSLEPNDEVSVIITDSSGTSAYSAIYLPAGFPTLQRTTPLNNDVADGQVLLTLSTFADGAPTFETAVDRNGVPVLVHKEKSSLDFKRQPNGSLSSSRASGTTPGRTGSAVVELGDDMEPTASQETVGLMNTDGHDSILRPDGSAFFVAYEPNQTTGNLDAIIQGVDAEGEVTFSWNSADHVSIEDETVLHDNPDYAHINSIVVTADGNILASFRHFSSVFKIALRSEDGHQKGDVLWRLGGHLSDFTFPGDPYFGPCAQHTASELPNGNILIFDNGSYGGPFGTFCIDPDNPTGPETTRPFTRITQYEIDESAGTANLVSSFTEEDRAALFAGGVERLENDNRMIGWASSRAVTATELSPDNAKLWELRDANPVVSARLFTYRAHVTTIADVIDPTVTLAVTDGATYDGKEVVRPAYSCTDRGGSSLQSCVTTGMKGNQLDTSTPGDHTVSVTATDAAGNIATVTRHYTVGELHRPDAAIRKSGSKRFAGDNVYGPAKPHQIVTWKLKKSKRTRIVRVRVGNDGNVAERFWVKGTKGTRKFRINYIASGKSVTRKVLAGTFRTPSVRPGKHWTLKLKVTRTAKARKGDRKRFTVKTTSVDGHPRDAVAVRTKAK